MKIIFNLQVALLTMYYEIKHEINVFGITSSYVIINRLNIDLQVRVVSIKYVYAWRIRITYTYVLT